METTKVFSDLLAAYVDPAVRVIALKGSTRSSKSWSTMQLLDVIAAKSKTPRLVSVVSETMPHLKRGVIRDYKNMKEADGNYNPAAWHDTDKLYSYRNGKLEFFSADQPGKVHGPARQVLYINEAINVSWEVYRQLAVRTTEKIILDYNPAYEFWVDTKLAPRADVRIIHSTYKDNDMLTASQISEIESNREIDPEWWKVYGLGETGSKAGLVMKKWDIVQSLPPRSEWKKAYIGVDFGWSNPSAVMLVVLAHGDLWIDELAYQKNMGNPDIANVIKAAGYKDLEVIADPAEPKSIKELRNAGLNAAEKGTVKDIKLGLQVMNRYKKHYTARSLGSIDENRKYRYPQDAEGNYIEDVPIDKFNHAKDAERYVVLNRLSNISTGFDVTTSARKTRKT